MRINSSGATPSIPSSIFYRNRTVDWVEKEVATGGNLLGLIRTLLMHVEHQSFVFPETFCFLTLLAFYRTIMTSNAWSEICPWYDLESGKRMKPSQVKRVFRSVWKIHARLSELHPIEILQKLVLDAVRSLQYHRPRIFAMLFVVLIR